MARVSRSEVFTPKEIAIVHLMNRVVRRCFLMGDDPLTGMNYDHRKVWIEDQFQLLAKYFGIDLLCYSVMSNHFHLILRSRPDIVETWSNEEVAWRWLMLCPYTTLGTLVFVNAVLCKRYLPSDLPKLFGIKLRRWGHRGEALGTQEIGAYTYTTSGTLVFVNAVLCKRYLPSDLPKFFGINNLFSHCFFLVFFVVVFSMRIKA